MRYNNVIVRHCVAAHDNQVREGFIKSVIDAAAIDLPHWGRNDIRKQVFKCLGHVKYNPEGQVDVSELLRMLR